LSWRALLGYGLLVALAAAGALTLAVTPADPDAGLPSVTNAERSGTLALFRFLERSGRNPLAWEAPLTGLPADVKVLVLPAPRGEPLSSGEREWLEGFVAKGGTLVVLAPDPVAGQPELATWLGLKETGPLGSANDRRHPDDDWSLVRMELPVPGQGSETWELHVSRGKGVSAEDAATLAGTSRAPFASWKKDGLGEVWIFANASFAQNDLIAGGANLEVWWALAEKGRLAWDEWHLRPRSERPMSPGLVLLGFQLLALAGMVAWSAGTRMGPVVKRVPERHRSPLEYVDSLAWVMRRNHVEPALVREGLVRIRRLVHERTGLPLQAPESQLVPVVASCVGMTSDEVRSLWLDAERLAEAPKVTPRQLFELDQRLATLELALRGAGRSAR
jgi:hypothetical protein